MYGCYFSLAWDERIEVLSVSVMHTFEHNQNTPPLPCPHYLFSIVGNPTLVDRTATVKPNRYIDRINNGNNIVQTAVTYTAYRLTHPSTYTHAYISSINFL